jgi:ribosomal subunit interface protein
MGMDITINSRHCTVPDSLRNQAEQRVRRLQRIGRGITAATLVFDAERNSRRVEARATMAGGPPIVGHGEGPTLRGAMDEALGRLERQLKRQRDRRVARRSQRVPLREPELSVE